MTDEKAKTRRTPPWALVLAILVALPLAGARLLLTAYKDPSGSMIPTILTGEHLYAKRLGEPPPRGEVVVFDSPENRQHTFIKRVVGLPGETIEALDGRPVIDGWLAPHCDVGAYTAEGKTYELYLEYLGDRAYGTVFEKKPEERACKGDADCAAPEACRGGVCGTLQGPFTVKPGEVFVMGDNRDNSHDSRMFFGGLGGGVPFADVTGTAWVVWLSPAGGRSFAALQGPPVLPREAASLQGALDKCLRDRPPLARTTPPHR